jgi:hypothetical protein
MTTLMKPEKKGGHDATGESPPGMFGTQGVPCYPPKRAREVTEITEGDNTHMHVRLEESMIMRIGDHHAEIPQIEKGQLRERAPNLQPGEGMIFHTHQAAGDSKNWFCYNCASLQMTQNVQNAHD